MAVPSTNSDMSIVALDVGERRIGVAIASVAARLPRPYGVLSQSSDITDQLAALLQKEQAAGLVIGLPRNLNGDDTAQTRAVRAFADRLRPLLDIPLYWTDEALTSSLAETELQHRSPTYSKGDVDALAACYILADFFANNKEILPA